VGPDAANAPMMFQPAPIPDDYQPSAVFYQLAKKFPDAKSSFALLNTTLPVNAAISAKITPAAQAAGFSIVDCGVTINYTGEPDYVPFAQKLKSCGAKVVYLPVNPGPVIYGLITAMNQVGAHPIYVMQHNGYSADFAKWNTAGYGDNVYVQSEFQPMENAATVPAVKTYLDLVKAVDGKTGLLGMEAASAFLLWADSVKQCGSTVTRQCVIDNLAEVHGWTAGGLQAPSDPGKNMPADCGMALKLDGTTWKQAFPAESGTFDCNPSYSLKVPADGWGTTLNADRIATKFLTADVLKPQP
jgi:ABC-type branched-subunit amino acid transport system substrate-binding protein